MQINIPPNTESIEIEIIEEEEEQSHSNWCISRFRVHSETIFFGFVFICCVICVSVCIYYAINENGETTTTRQNITNATVTATDDDMWNLLSRPMTTTTTTMATTTAADSDHIWNPLR